ncbi:MAG: hypothetical protein NXI04_15345 [Planctomycetaceae bacterium]|nr:hypothetical protein [Planctomycetaceae bacterium]
MLRFLMGILPLCGWLTCFAQEESARLFEQPVDRSLTTGEYAIVQTWSQETDFDRPYFVKVPKTTAEQRWPVFIYLHGNGGDARRTSQGIPWKLREISRRYVMVFPQGYERSWNIVSERSEADDLAFLESIIGRLQQYDNVAGDNVTIMGSSNGAALVNQLAIESQLPQIRNYISCVSPLNVWQHDGSRFRRRGADNSYTQAVVPPTGKRLLNVSGTEDRLVPYAGGPSAAIRAKDGKLKFLPAEKSTYLWARHYGYQGEQLMTPTSSEGPLEYFRYLDGGVVHLKVNGEGHGATRIVDDRILLKFLTPMAAGASDTAEGRN